MVRVYDPEDDKNGSEVIHLLLTPKNILGVYQETGKPVEEVKNVHRILRKMVMEFETKGQKCDPAGRFQSTCKCFGKIAHHRSRKNPILGRIRSSQNIK